MILDVILNRPQRSGTTTDRDDNGETRPRVVEQALALYSLFDRRPVSEAHFEQVYSSNFRAAALVMPTHLKWNLCGAG